MTFDLSPRIVTVVKDPMDLTPREISLVLGLGRGLSTKEIAHDNGTTYFTTKAQLFNLTEKTGWNRTQLTVLGSRMLEAMAS